VSVEQGKSTVVEERNRQLEVEIRELQEKYNTQSASLQVAERKIAVQLEEVSKLNTEITSEKEQSNDVTTRLKSSQDAIELLRSERSQLEQQVAELSKQSSDRLEQIRYLEEQLKGKTHEFENLCITSSETKDRLAILEEQFATAKAGQELEQSTIAQLRQELSEEKSTRELLGSQLKSCQFDLTTEQERNKELELELSTKSSLAVASKEEADLAHQEVVTLKEKAIEQDENMRRLQALLNEEQTARTSLGAEKEASSQLTQDLVAKLEEMTKQLQAKDEELQTLVKKLDEKTHELQTTETQMTDLAAKTNALEETANRLSEELKAQSKRVTDAEEHNKQLVCAQFMFNELDIDG
jgi:chromosome segregation ATPase